jgi:DNA-binding transcriptional LysR family regulator
MHAVDVSRVDLNLLVALEALLSARSVGLAARTLGLSQPAASHALARLRTLFGDPLLVRVGRAMERTPRGEALLPNVVRVLADAGRLFSHDDAFDPRQSTRTFSLVCPDALVAVAPQLLARLATDAPHTALEVQTPLGFDVHDALARGAADLALGPTPERASGIVVRSLGSVRFAVVARRGHPAIVRGAITQERWAAAGHVLVRTSDLRASAVSRAMESAGLTRRVGFYAPSFLAAPFVVAETDLLFHAPRALVADLARKLDLVVVDAPIPLPALSVALAWHERMHADAGHRFVRQLLVDVIAPALAERGARGGVSAGGTTRGRSRPRPRRRP